MHGGRFPTLPCPFYAIHTFGCDAFGGCPAACRPGVLPDILLLAFTCRISA